MGVGSTGIHTIHVPARRSHKRVGGIPVVSFTRPLLVWHRRALRSCHLVRATEDTEAVRRKARPELFTEFFQLFTEFFCFQFVFSQSVIQSNPTPIRGPSR